MSEAHLPTRLLERFTDREDEQQRFREILATPMPQSLPTLNFHGVGGVGKTWLRFRLESIRRQEFPQISAALIDYDQRTLSGARYIADPSDAWFEIARKLKIPCPKFLLAYAVLLAKQTDAAVEAHKLTHGEASKMDVAGQLAGELLGSDWIKAALDGIPFAGLVPFVARKGVEKWKETKVKGSSDFQELEGMEAEQIYQILLPRLIEDLNAHVPKNASKQPGTGQCHSLVFFDTFEVLGDGFNKARQSEQEAWVRKFARGTTRTLVVILGQNRVTWDEKPGEKFWTQRAHLETHLVGSLSEQDARLYLQRCEISDRALQMKCSATARARPSRATIPGRWACAATRCGRCARSAATARFPRRKSSCSKKASMARQR